MNNNLTCLGQSVVYKHKESCSWRQVQPGAQYENKLPNRHVTGNQVPAPKINLYCYISIFNQREWSMRILLHFSYEQHGINANETHNPYLVMYNGQKGVTTYFLFSICGKLLLENLSTMTCKQKLLIQDCHVHQARDAKQRLRAKGECREKCR